jgi:spore germination protein YaaH
VIKNIVFAIFGVLVGAIVGYFFIFRTPVRSVLKISGNRSMGFLPYWLLGKASKDYSKYLDGIYYFGLTVGDEGNIVKFANLREKEPDWYALESGKVEPYIQNVHNNHQTLSLVVFSGVDSSIGVLISDSIRHADNLISDITPIMKSYGFTDLNLDIEYVDIASESARTNFTQFVREIRKNLNDQKLGTLSIDVSPTAFIKNYLIDPVEVSKLVDTMVIMGYDYHFQGSYVTGPVAPLFGASVISEYDIQTAVEKALTIMPSAKIVLGVPLYGYEWETIGSYPRSPVIPGTGLIASSKRISQLLSQSSTFSAKLDAVAEEKYLIYKDTDTNSYHQIFYPDQEVMKDKIEFAQKYNLGGIALWALGYEDPLILNPLKDY